MELYDSLGNLVPEDAFIVRATEFGQYINCARNWMFNSQNGLNLEPRIINPKLRFGTIWHKAMEALYDPKTNEKPMDVLKTSFNESLAFMEGVVGVEMFNPEMVEEVHEEKLLAEGLMMAYEEWRKSPDVRPSDDDLKFIRTERRYVVPIGDAYLAMKLDGEVEVVNQPGLWVLEHKTRSKSTRVDNPPEVELDFQMGLQMLGLSYVEENNVRGVIYNLARKQLPSNRVRSPIFGRHRVQRTPNMLRNLESYFIQMTEYMKADRQRIKELGIDAVHFMRYNPQPLGLCSWGCNVKEACEAANRGEDVSYHVESKLQPRERPFFEVLTDEMEEGAT